MVKPAGSVANTPKNNNMKITCPFIANQKQIPKLYTCDGSNINPPLNFNEVPPETKSLVLIMDDPDAPGGTWVHWVIFDMNHSVRFIDQNKKPPSGVEGMTSFGKPGYGGPCPPSGTHRYFFRLIALDTILNLPQSADINQVEDKMQGHVLQRAELVGLYSRQ